jgi:hypothetical protein
MILNEKVINYKIIDLVNLYNLGIKFDFIRNYMKSYEFFYVGLFASASDASGNTLKYISRGK